MGRKILLLVSFTTTMLVVVANGCNSDLFSGDIDTCCPTDPRDPRFDDDICVEGREQLAAARDAGYDGAGCRAIFPGQEVKSVDEVIETVCVPNAPDNFHPPQPLWVGAGADDPGCPAEVGAFGDRRYNNIDPPPESCPVCECGPIEGTCSPQPNSIQIRADFCEVAQTYTSDFSSPQNWDGSCTNVHALPAGAECPAGSGVPCARSLYASALPDPQEECKPISQPVPKLHSGWITWGTRVLSCNATPIDLTCPDHDSTRFAMLPQGWRHCVRHQQNGIHECPSGSMYKDQVIAYSYESYTNTRHCTECGCKASGGTCSGTFNVYEDEQCTKFIDMATLNSETHECDNLPVGTAVGSKELVDLVYVPGKCVPTGGVPIGEVKEKEAEAATWCCLE